MAQVYSVNPFLSNLTDFDARAVLGFDRSPARDAGPTGYALVQSGPSVSAEECENLAARAVEVTVLWGTTVLYVTHLDPPRAFFVGETSSKAAPCDYTLPAEKLGASRIGLIEMHAGEPTLVVPAHATARVSSGASAMSAAAPGSRIPLVLGTRAEVSLGDLRIQVGGVHPGKRTERSVFGAADSSTGTYFALSLAAVGAFIGAMAAFVPSLGLTDDEGMDQQRLYAIQQYLDASAERNRELAAEQAAKADPQQGGGERAEAAKGDSGAMGKRTAALANRRAGVKGPKDNPEPHLAREAALHEAQNFGMIGLLRSDLGGDPNAPTAPWGRETSSGTDDASALGNMWGDEIGESRGSGGLGLTGIGEGGGGRGLGIGMGGIGTCGGTICSGLEGGFGRSLAHTGAPGHNPGGPKVRLGATEVTSGTLPAEVIQRIVRQNFGRFRMCYEQGLSRNPNLQGRVSVRFVIDRNGAVSNAGNGGSDLPDSGVVSCVVSAYYGLSFPAPKDGIVTVNYPIMFSPG